MALLEGAEAARATASGMAAVTASLMGQVKAGDHVVAARALFGSCLYVVEELLPRFGVASTLVDGADLDALAGGRAAEHQDGVPRNRRPTRRSRSSTSPPSPRSCTAPARRWWSTTCSPRRCCQHPLKLGADCVVYSATKHIDGQGRVLGGVILAQREIHRRPHPQFPAPDRPVPLAVQRLDAAEVAGDAADPRRGADARGRADRRLPRRPSGGRRARSIPAAPIIRRRRLPGAR